MTRGVIGAATGKYYFEFTPSVWAVSNSSSGGIATGLLTQASTGTNTATIGKSGSVAVNGAGFGAGLGALTAGNTVGVAVDLTNGLFWTRLCPSGNWNGSGTANPATGAGGAGLSTYGTTPPALGTMWFPYYGQQTSSGDVATYDFGASAYVGTPPSGFGNWPSVPSTKQQLQAQFTPLRPGRVRGLVRVGRPTTTLWVDPRLRILPQAPGAPSSLVVTPS
jgi:hypothetical protein